MPAVAAHTKPPRTSSESGALTSVNVLIAPSLLTFEIRPPNSSAT